MLSIAELDSLLVAALKAKDQLRVDTLRGLKTRLKNEQIAKGAEPSEMEILQIIRSEIKRRNEAVESFTKGGNTGFAEKEKQEAVILQAFLPPSPNMDEVKRVVAQYIAENNLAMKDFGKVIGHFKTVYGASLDGSELSAIIKSILG